MKLLPRKRTYVVDKSHTPTCYVCVDNEHRDHGDRRAVLRLLALLCLLRETRVFQKVTWSKQNKGKQKLLMIHLFS